MKKAAVKRQNPESKAVKKVNWRPASKLGTFNAPKGYRVRWASDTSDNIARKKAEGWEILDKSKFPELEGSDYDHQVTDSKGLTKSVLKRNELIAMIIPEEKAKERDEYYRQETEDQTRSALSHVHTRELIEKINPKNKRNVISINPTDAGVSVID